MEKVFLCGHKNPDTDSIASAASYAYLKSQIDREYEYVPIRCGVASAQTKFIFEKAEAKLPDFMKDLYPKVADSMTKNIMTVEESDPLSKFLRLMREQSIRSMPVVDSNNKYKGMLGVNDLTELFIRDDRQSKPVFSLSADTLRRSLRGTVLNVGELEAFEASIVVASMAWEEFHNHMEKLGGSSKNTIIITANRPHILEEVFKQDYPAVIIVGLDENSALKINFNGFKGWVFSSPYDTSQTIRCVEMGTPISKVMHSVDPISPDDYVDTVHDVISKTGRKSIPVVQDNNLVGVITGTDLLNKKRAKLILLDHNEMTQAIDGVEACEIVEIIDHHRLGTIKTNSPVMFYAKPVGSTCTLVYQLYKTYRVEIPKKIAMLLLGGMLSDTVIMKSPTTTEVDIEAINELAKYCGVDAKEYGVEIFSATDGLTTRSASEIINTDFKIFNENGVSFAISQAETVTLAQFPEIKEKLLAELENIKSSKNLDWVMILVTDIIKEESVLLTTGHAAESIFGYKKTEDNLFFLPGVLSRKKQLLPEVLRVLEEIGK